MSHPMDLVDSRPRYQRIGVHLIVVADGGSARMAVDFTEHDIGPGTVVWVRPGQVFRWLEVAELSAIALVFPSGVVDAALDPAGVAKSGRTCWHLTGSTRDEVLTLAGVLERARTRPSAAPLSPTDPTDPMGAAGARHLLTALVIRLLRSGPPPPRTPSATTFARFRAAVDASFAERHAVADYATALGASPRTLSRTTRAATGFSPKQVIDARILLEARRLLAYTRRPVGEIGAQLGFDDASNFASWFAIRAGCTPSEFRARAGLPDHPAG